MSGRTTIVASTSDGGRQIKAGQMLSRRFATGGVRSWFNGNFSVLCYSAERCRLLEIGLGPSFKWKSLSLTIDYQFLPHATLLTTEWRVSSRQVIFASYLHRNDPIRCLSIICDNRYEAVSSGGERDFLQTDYSFAYRWGLLTARMNLNQAILPETARRSTNVSLGIGERRDSLTWDILTTQDLWLGMKWPALLASVRFYSDFNLGRLALNLRRHRISGFVRSSITNQPIANAKVVLSVDGEIQRQTMSNEVGAYLLEDIPQTSSFEIEITNAGIGKKFTIAKDLRDVLVERDFMVADYVRVSVRFLVDVNRNGIIDKEDTPIALANEIPEIQDAIVTGPGASVGSDHILFPRSEKVVLKCNQAMLPSRYQLVAMNPEIIDTLKEESVKVLVLLKEAQ